MEPNNCEKNYKIDEKSLLEEIILTIRLSAEEMQ